MDGISHLQLNENNHHLKSKYEYFSYDISRGDSFPFGVPMSFLPDAEAGLGLVAGEMGARAHPLPQLVLLCGQGPPESRSS